MAVSNREGAGRRFLQRIASGSGRSLARAATEPEPVAERAADDRAAEVLSLSRQLDEAREALAERDRRLWQVETTLVRIEGNLQAIAASRSWRWGHRVSVLARRFRRKAPIGGGAVTQAIERMRILRADVGAQSPAKVIGSAVERVGDSELATDPRQVSAVGVGLPATIVIAVYNALDETRRCLDSVVEHTDPAHRVLIIDDASTDSRVRPLLASYNRRFAHVDLLVHEENRGYTRTINEGCAEATGDVILLNSDTAVTAGWLESLAKVAYARHDIATVTPVSNAAGVFSVPEMNQNGELPEGITVEAMGALVRRVSTRARPVVPTGNGFCMYIRQTALAAVGSFDVEAFPRGYGEENDFCQRAVQAGLRNVVDDAAFVYHQRTASFGADKDAAIASARKVMREKHPQYAAEVARLLADDPLRDLRAAVGSALSKGPDEVERLPRSRPTALFVLHAGKGGTPATTLDLISAISASFRCLLLRCDLESWTLEEFSSHGWPTMLQTFEFADPWRATDLLGGDREDALRQVCTEHGVALVHIRSFIGLGPEVIDVVKRIGLPVVVSLHDFFTVCPTIQLIDEHGRYCGGHCTSGEGRCPTSKRWIEGLPQLKHSYVYEWRSRMTDSLRLADRFVTTSDAAREVLVEHFPLLGDGRLEVIEHGRDVQAFELVGEPPAERPRVVCFGALNVSKGIHLIHDLLELDRLSGSRFDFHFLGDRHTDFLPERLGGIHHGPYQRGELPGLIASIRPSYALVSSIWPETYCHTLTEAWMAGLPTFATDIGTLHERIGRHGGGWLLPQDDSESFYAGMRRVADDPEEWTMRRAEIERMPTRTVDEMGSDYRHLYRDLLAVV
jgi:GT2 family glycosyltransferase/glycosyltransferase involved in cell wall biosynthesis